MDVPELNLRECESVFVRDEFYENIQAPKFHDFCSDEDPVVDADAYFRRLGGRSPRPSTDPFPDQNAFKGSKECTVLKPPGLPKAPLSSLTLNTDVTSSVPKASSAGLKKAKPAVSMLATPLTKSQDKAPSKNKMYQRVSTIANPSLSSTVSDGKGNDSAQAPSVVKLSHVSENTDPNGTSQAKRKVTSSGGSKSDEVLVLSVTGSLQASIHAEGVSKMTSESQVLVKTRSQIRKSSKEKSDSAIKKVTDAAVVEISDVKDRKRKPIPRVADAGLTKVYETRSRVSKQQRKSSTFSDPNRLSGISDIGQSSSQCVKPNCSELKGGSMLKAAAERRTSRRSSDSSRRRRASGGLKARPGRRALVTGSKSIANVAQETTGNDSTPRSVSSSMQFGFNATNKHPSVTEDQNLEKSVTTGVVPPELTSVPAFTSPDPIGTSNSSVHTTEARSAESEVSIIPISGRAPNSQAPSGDGDFALQSVQKVPFIQDTSMYSDQQEVNDSVGHSLLEKLQKLQLQPDSKAAKETEANYSPETVVVGEVKDGSGAPNYCSREYPEVLAIADHFSTSEAGFPTCTDLNSCEAESGLDASDEFSMPKVVPSVAEEEVVPDSIRSQDTDLSVDGSPPTMCEVTAVSRECTVAVTDQADIVGLLQNLQINSNRPERAESELPCHGDAGGASCRETSLAGDKRQCDTPRIAGNDEQILSVSRTGFFSVAAGTTQEVKTVNETRLLKRLLPKGPSSESHDNESDISCTKGPHFFMDNQQKRKNKRKSIELGTHHSEQRSITTSDILNVDEQPKSRYQVKVTSQSSLAPLTHSLSSSASRVAVPSGTSGQHKKMKTTCPQPFRLRTEERGALKEVEFNKKVELYLAAKEKMQNVPFQFTTSKDSRNTGRPLRNPLKDTKKSLKHIHQHTQSRAAERALFDVKITEKSMRADEEKQEKEKRMQLVAEEEIKRMRKQMVPHAQRMPFFDRPFKPHRSTKTLTVPSSPKFHSLKTKKSCAHTSTQE